MNLLYYREIITRRILEFSRPSMEISTKVLVFVFFKVKNGIEERSESRVGDPRHPFPLFKICVVIFTLAWSRCHKQIFQEGAPNALTLGGGLCLNT